MNARLPVLLCLVITCTTLRGADPAGNKPAAPRAEQSAEAKEFRKTAINVTYPSQGMTLHGWVYKPAGDGPFPAVIWNHGSEQNPKAHPELGMFYTKHGYVLFLPVRDGHLPSPGTYIVDEQNAISRTNIDAWRAKVVELHDKHNLAARDAIAWIKQQPYVDAKRVAVTGCSYGGIQTLITGERDVGVCALIPFSPGAMSWANTKLQEREKEAVQKAKAPLFLIQAKNDYGIGPSEILGPMITAKGGINRAKLYPAFGSTPADGHAGFACSEAGIAIWGPDVLGFLKDAGMSPSVSSPPR
jgi:carboxymethylenebutenolidase